MHFYTKLFHRILDSSVWLEDDKTVRVWIAMLASKDENHIVEMPLPVLANRARVTVDECRKAIKKFLSPDPDSSSKAFDGKRIEVVERGWRLLNGQYYEDLERIERRRAQWRKASSEYRAKSQLGPGEQAYVDAIKRGDTPREPNS